MKRRNVDNALGRVVIRGRWLTKYAANHCATGEYCSLEVCAEHFCDGVVFGKWQKGGVRDSGGIDQNVYFFLNGKCERRSGNFERCGCMAMPYHGLLHVF